MQPTPQKTKQRSVFIFRVWQDIDGMPWQEEEEEVTSGPWADIMEYSPRWVGEVDNKSGFIPFDNAGS